jgi:hypothetical protein
MLVYPALSRLKKRTTEGKRKKKEKNLGLGHQFSKLVEPALLRLHTHSQK